MGYNAAPECFDVDQDGDNDCFVGSVTKYRSDFAPLTSHLLPTSLSRLIRQLRRNLNAILTLSAGSLDGSVSYYENTETGSSPLFAEFDRGVVQELTLI